MKKNLHWLFGLLCLSSCSGPAGIGEGGKPFQDLSHDSKVFGHKKFYRIYLPGGYDASSRRYPVIYFFHGWGGRHFKDDNAKLEYPLLKPLADKYGVILVMWDGNIDEAEPNPYNIGYHDDVKFQVQMKDYFPELVAHIDTTYRTLTDRNHRGIIGFSMGGFMSLYIAGKYPDSVCAAVSLAGSPEFFVGWPGNQTLYPMRYTFSNLQDEAVYIRNGNSDILYYLNEEVHAGAVWEGKKLDYEPFAGGHSIDSPGQTRIFDKAMQFVADAFKKELPAPEQWSHYDLYPDFGVWGYQVQSNKRTPGYIFLKNAGKSGFGLFTRRWLPDGPAIGENCDVWNRMPACGVSGGEGLHIHVTTAPVYVPGKVYGTATLAADSGGVLLSEAMSDAQGRIGFDLDGNGHQVGIFDADSEPDFVVRNYSLKGQGEGRPWSKTRNGGVSDGRGAGGPNGRSTGVYLHIGERNLLTLQLFNRGGEKKMPAIIQVSLTTSDSTVRILEPNRIVRTAAGKRILDLPPFEIACYKKPPPHAEPPDIKFKINISEFGMSDGKTFRDDLNVPVYFEAPLFDSVRIDDGVAIRDSAWGKGDADGVADAGERIMIYQGAHRLRLYTEDPWVDAGSERLADEVIPARWPDGYTFSSIIQLAPDCPDGHTIEFVSSYETKSFNPIERRLHWGRVKVTVRNKVHR